MFSLAIVYTSATLTAAAVNSLPVLTFFFAFLFRFELSFLSVKPI